MRYVVALLLVAFAAGSVACARNPGESPITSRKDAGGNDALPGARGASLEKLDAENGFQGLKFGSPLAEDMKLVEDDGVTQTYVWPGKKFTIGKGELDEVQFVFHQNRLTSVLMTTKEAEDSRAVRDTFLQTYGPSSSDQAWRGERVVLSFRGDGTGGANIVLWSREMMASVGAAWKAKRAEEEKAKAMEGVN